MAATLSREEMERVIREGGSVLYGGRTISRLEDLPNEVDLAQGDEAKQQALAADIDAQIAALITQRARLVSGAPAVQQQSAPPASGEASAAPPSGETTPPSGETTPPGGGSPSSTDPPPSKPPKPPKES
jgi:hypothetical protein